MPGPTPAPAGGLHVPGAFYQDALLQDEARPDVYRILDEIDERLRGRLAR